MSICSSAERESLSDSLLIEKSVVPAAFDLRNASRRNASSILENCAMPLSNSMPLLLAHVCTSVKTSFMGGTPSLTAVS